MRVSVQLKWLGLLKCNKWNNPVRRKIAMRMTLILGKLVAIMLMFSFIFGSPHSAQSAQTQPLVVGNTAFALELYGRLQTNPATHIGRPNERRMDLTLRLEGKKETVLVGEVYF